MKESFKLTLNCEISYVFLLKYWIRIIHKDSRIKTSVKKLYKVISVGVRLSCILYRYSIVNSITNINKRTDGRVIYFLITK